MHRTHNTHATPLDTTHTQVGVQATNRKPGQHAAEIALQQEALDKSDAVKNAALRVFADGSTEAFYPGRKKKRTCPGSSSSMNDPPATLDDLILDDWALNAKVAVLEAETGAAAEDVPVAPVGLRQRPVGYEMSANDWATEWEAAYVPVADARSRNNAIHVIGPLSERMFHALGVDLSVDANYNIIMDTFREMDAMYGVNTDVEVSAYRVLDYQPGGWFCQICNAVIIAQGVGTRPGQQPTGRQQHHLGWQHLKKLLPFMRRIMGAEDPRDLANCGRTEEGGLRLHDEGYYSTTGYLAFEQAARMTYTPGLEVNPYDSMTPAEIIAVEEPWYLAAKQAAKALFEGVSSSDATIRAAAELQRHQETGLVDTVAFPTYPHICSGRVGADCAAWHVVPK